MKIDAKGSLMAGASVGSVDANAFTGLDLVGADGVNVQAGGYVFGGGAYQRFSRRSVN